MDGEVDKWMEKWMNGWKGSSSSKFTIWALGS